MFEDLGDIKSAEKIWNDIKKVQEVSLPSGMYVKKLRKKLYDTHLVDEAMESQSGFNFYRFLWVFGSSAFIFFALFFLYDMRTDMSDSALVSPVLDSDIPKEIIEIHERKIIPDDVQGEGVQDLSEIDEEISESYSEENNPIQAPTNTPQKIEEISPSDDVIPEEESWEENISQDTLIDNEISSWENNLQNFAPESNTSASNASSLSIFQEDVDEPADDYSDEIYEDSEAIYFYELERFIEICERNQGTLQDDEYTCVFPDGNICNSDNIYPEAQAPCQYLYPEKSNSE